MATAIIVTYYIFEVSTAELVQLYMKKPTAVGDESTMVDPSLLHYKSSHLDNSVSTSGERTGIRPASMVGGWRKGSGEPDQTMGEQLPAAFPPPIRGGVVG